MIKTHKRVNSCVRFYYPVHGRGNCLRLIEGVVIDKGIGPNGPYLTVQETSGQIRSLSTKKIVTNI